MLCTEASAFESSLLGVLRARFITFLEGSSEVFA